MSTFSIVAKNLIKGLGLSFSIGLVLGSVTGSLLLVEWAFKTYGFVWGSLSTLVILGVFLGAYLSIRDLIRTYNT